VWLHKKVGRGGGEGDSNQTPTVVPESLHMESLYFWLPWGCRCAAAAILPCDFMHRGKPRQRVQVTGIMISFVLVFT